MSEEKIYCGKGKLIGQYGNIGISICIDDIPKEHIFTSQNGKRYIKAKVCAKRQTDQYGNSHYVCVDTWKPNGGQASNNSAGNMTNQDFANEGFEQVNIDSIPF